MEIPNIQHLLHNGETTVVYTDNAHESKSGDSNLDVSINNPMSEHSTKHGSDLSSSHDVHIDSHITEASGLTSPWT